MTEEPQPTEEGSAAPIEADKVIAQQVEAEEHQAALDPLRAAGSFHGDSFSRGGIRYRLGTGRYW